MSVDAPTLMIMPLAQLVTFWRPGSHDWTWAEEIHDVTTRDAEKTRAIRERVEQEGVGFQDHIAPILLGNDGRVWDGHHRICIAILMGVPSLMVETTEENDEH